MLIAVDTFGLAKLICNEKDSANTECIHKTRTALYIGLIIAFVILVPLQFAITMLFEAIELAEEK